MRSARFVVVFDACVLYPYPLRDLLVELGKAGLFQATWSAQIQDEWRRNLLGNKPGLKPEKLDRTIALMNQAIPAAQVDGYQYLIDAVKGLPDPDDRHVVACAIHAKANAIVTRNLKDFPSAIMKGFDIDAIHPDDFITHQIDLDQAKVITAAKHCHGRLLNPPLTPEEYLASLERQALPKTVQFLRKYAGVLGGVDLVGEARRAEGAEIFEFPTRAVAKPVSKS